MERRRFLGGVGVGVGLGVAGCLGFDDEGDYDVGMQLRSFDPVEVTVSVGDTVVWKNTSAGTHTVTAYGGGIPEEAAFFASGGYEDEQAAREAWHDSLGGGMENGDTFSHTFEVAGEYQYFCIPHEQGGMRGRVVVEESGGSSNSTNS